MSDGDLSRESRALLALAKDGGLPDEAQLAHTRARLAERIGAGAVAGAFVATAAKTASAPVVVAKTAVSSSLTMKLLAVMALVGGGAAGGYTYHVHRQMAVRHAPVAAPAPAASAADVSRPVPLDLEAPRPTAPAPHGPLPRPIAQVSSAKPAVHPAEESEPARAREPVRAAPASIPVLGAEDSTSSVSRSPRTAPEGLMEDVNHLRSAQRALAEGDAARARREVELVRADGPLAEERHGLRVLVECSAPKRTPEMEKLVDDFARARPESALLPRIRAACAR
ncbi:hypothetical protein [Pendulispora albinea]|uniref:Uncharacterized protein n=1 Tax=Pendulispora albinea TaxID=2741071 RepID=A0ABZ2M132_9BACT